MNLPTKPDQTFVKIADAQAVIVTKKGVRQPLPLYAFDGDVYFQWQGGYVRITSPNSYKSREDRVAFDTEHPDLWASHVIGHGVHAQRTSRNGQTYLVPKE